MVKPKGNESQETLKEYCEDTKNEWMDMYESEKDFECTLNEMGFTFKDCDCSYICTSAKITELLVEV